MGKFVETPNEEEEQGHNRESKDGEVEESEDSVEVEAWESGGGEEDGKSPEHRSSGSAHQSSGDTLDALRVEEGGEYASGREGEENQ